MKFTPHDLDLLATYIHKGYVVARVLNIQHCRAQVASWKKKLYEAENQLEDLLTPLPVQGPGPAEDKAPSPKKRGRKGAKYPEDENIEAIRDIMERGEISAEHLVVMLFDEDDRENRKKVYSRIKHYKNKGWLVKTLDGDWTVAQDVVDRLKAKETKVNEESWLEKAAREAEI